LLQKSASVRQAAALSDGILELLASSSCRNVPREERESERCVQFVSRTLNARSSFTELGNAESQAEPTDKVNDYSSFI
jgi:hypothetical protein